MQTAMTWHVIALLSMLRYRQLAVYPSVGIRKQLSVLPVYACACAPAGCLIRSCSSGSGRPYFCNTTHGWLDAPFCRHWGGIRQRALHEYYRSTVSIWRLGNHSLLPLGRSVQAADLMNLKFSAVTHTLCRRVPPGDQWLTPVEVFTARATLVISFWRSYTMRVTRKEYESSSFSQCIFAEIIYF